jgi:glutathione reductase (NADPH)
MSMAGFDYDLFVIGAGSGGVRAARFAANFGSRVAIAEERYFGGTCVNVGCIPKKLFVYASHVHTEVEDARAYGWTTDLPRFDWPTLIRNKDKEITRLNGIYEQILRNAGVEIIAERARVTGPQEVQIAGRTIRAERILVATGGWPQIPKIPGREHAISSNEAFHLEQLPPRIAIVGGGYIAVEFAGIFHGLGVETTLIHRGEVFLRGFDHDLRAGLAREMTREGVPLKFSAAVANITRNAQGLILTLSTGETLATDMIMFATGRMPNTADLGLREVGVALDASGAVIVSDEYQTNVPSIYAIGDVTNRVNLTPVALAEAMAFTRRVYGGMNAPVDYEAIPTAVFSNPPIGTVGPTEEEARKRYGDIVVFRSTFTPLKHTLTGRGEKTLMKLLVDRKSDRVIAAHMLGPDAGEIIQGIAIAIRAGATKAQFDSTIGIHPTAAEEFVTMRTPVES